MKKYLLLTLFFNLFLNAQQTTVGLLFHDNAVTDGYVLYSPSNNNEVYLINNCGEKINQWSFTEIPGATCYLLANGNLLRAGKDNLEIRDWDNNVVWTYGTTSNNIKQHHDIEPLPNGNILCVVADPYTPTQMTAMGRNPALLGGQFRLEKVIEIQPVGTNSANIVWEWKFANHLIQDFDSTKPNYGVVEDHPELLDINYNNGSTTDYLHMNGIDYNASLDQILISARHLNEIIIIDHSTTTAQAASHIGGTSTKGGDFLWRWGNPIVYRKGTIADRKLFLQHNPMWVDNGYLDEGKISVFNNGEPGSAQTYSSVDLIQPDIVNGNYTMTNGVFNPSAFDWSWSGMLLGTTFYQERQSGMQSQPNGNVIISESILGRISEITKTGTLLWSYKNPSGPIVNGSVTYSNQFSTTNNEFFKAEKYPSTFPGFIGKDLTPNGILEDTNSLSFDCNGSLSTPSISSIEKINVVNPITNSTLLFNQNIENTAITIFDINGRKVYERKSFSGNTINVDLTPSVYFMKIEKDSILITIKIIIE